MSGHSKWHTIKHKKGAADAKRGKMFEKLAKEIAVAARMGGGDPDSNARLRKAVADARGQSMPNDKIENAIKRGTGEIEGVSYEELTYEGYGPGGVAIMVTVLTDNRNRTVADVRSTFQRHGGSLGESGCVSWMFARKGVIVVEAGAPAAVDEDRLMEVALEAGADDVQEHGDSFEVTTSPESFEKVREALDKLGAKVASAEVALVPQNTVPVRGAEAQQCLRLLEALEDHDDVQSVAANADIDEETLAKLSA